MGDIRLRADVSDFLRNVDAALPKVAEAIVRGVANTAQRARDEVRAVTKREFELHSDWIPGAIRSIPDPGKTKAVAAASKALMGRHRDFKATVYLRGANDPKKSLGYMVEHETGGIRRSARGRSLAAPGRGLEKYMFKTSRGAVRKNWKPAKLLEYYNQVGPAGKGSKRHGKTRGKPKPFIMQTARGRMIVRRQNRKTRKIEVLYRFIEHAQIDRRWGFVRTVHTSAYLHLSKDIQRELNKLV